MKTLTIRTFPFWKNRVFINPVNWKIHITNSPKKFIKLKVLGNGDVNMNSNSWKTITQIFIDDPII